MRHTLTERFVPSAHLFLGLMYWFGASAYHHLLFFWAEVVNRAPTMILFSSKGESELDTPFVIPYLLCQIVLFFAKLNRPRKCWRLCLSKFEYIFPWLLNSLQNYLANSLSWGIYLRYRERIWNGGGTDLGLGGLFLWQCKVTTISPYKKIHEQLFTHWTMLIEVNQCNVLKDNKISCNVKTYRVTPQKVQYIVNLLYTHPIVLPVFFSIIYI